MLISTLSTVNCSQLMEPMNGTMSCSLSMILYKDICSFTCDTGYVLIGSSTRTCQIDGNWSGSQVNCTLPAGMQFCKNENHYSTSYVHLNVCS